MKKMKVISLLLVAILVVTSLVTLVACTDKDEDRIELLVWAPSAAQTFYKTWADKWAKDYKDSQGRQYKIKMGIKGEGDAKTDLLYAVQDGADVFAFADDQLGELVNAGAISRVGDPSAEGTTAKDVATRNSAGSVQAATYKGANDEKEMIYAYPMQADNGYFLYYDANVLSEEDVSNWDKLWAKVEQINQGAAQRKKVLWAFGTAWYQAAWFFSFGGTVSTTATNFHTDEVGLPALKAAYKFGNHQDLMSVDPNDGTEGIKDGDIVAAVAGGWIYDDVKGGDADIKLTVLPAIVDEDGVEHPMYSFLGSKLFGVNAQRDYQEASHSLANYLTSEEVQIAKAEALSAGPSNINAADSDVAKNLPTVQALAKQAEHSVPQINLPAGFWDALPAAVDFVKADHDKVGDYFPGGVANDAQLRTLLQAMYDAMKLAA